MNIKITQKSKKGAFEDTIKQLKAFKKDLSVIANESAERVRSELVKSGKKYDKVSTTIINGKDKHGVKINIETPTETIGVEALVKITDKDQPIPLGMLNEQMDTGEDEGNVFGVKKEKEMTSRMVKRILNEVFYKRL